MTRVYLSQAMEKIESAARKVIAAVADGDMLRTQLAILRRLAKYEPFNTIELAPADRAEDDRAGEIHARIANIECRAGVSTKAELDIRRTRGFAARGSSVSSVVALFLRGTRRSDTMRSR